MWNEIGIQDIFKKYLRDQRPGGLWGHRIGRRFLEKTSKSSNGPGAKVVWCHRFEELKVQ